MGQEAEVDKNNRRKWENFFQNQKYQVPYAYDQPSTILNYRCKKHF